MYTPECYIQRLNGGSSTLAVGLEQRVEAHVTADAAPHRTSQAAVAAGSQDLPSGISVATQRIR